MRAFLFLECYINFYQRKPGAVALPFFKKGYISIIGEWVALPLIKFAGSTKPGDVSWEQRHYPIAHQPLLLCASLI